MAGPVRGGECAVGESSCFTVWLPLRATEGTTKAPVGARVQETSGAPVALVVEHDPKSAELIRLQLEADGFQVLHADSAEGGADDSAVEHSHSL